MMYLIENCGCDDTTLGLVELNDEQIDLFVRTIINLNMNSTYGCMPTVNIYRVPDGKFRKMTKEEIENDDMWSEGFIEKRDRIYYSGMPYTFTEEYGRFNSYGEQIPTQF